MALCRRRAAQPPAPYRSLAHANYSTFSTVPNSPSLIFTGKEHQTQIFVCDAEQS